MPQNPTPRAAAPGAERCRVAIVVNPTKVDDQARLRRECNRAAADAGLPEPLWFETTREEPGVSQAQDAVAAGCDIVFAAGGDGTVRYVGSALVGTDVALGIMPQGTGNLLARNLGVSVDGSATENFVRSIGGSDRRIDVGRVHATFDDGTAVNDTFLIMAGFGLDADIMVATSERLKKRIGWLAYPVAGVKFFTQRPERMLASFDDGAPQTKKTTSLLVGNCGLLTGGVQLMPDAQADDGWFDTVWLSADGPVQWASMSRQILLRGDGDAKRLERITSQRVSAQAMGRPRNLELDGDVIGAARQVEMWVEQSALTVRIAEPRSPRLSALRRVMPGRFGQGSDY